VELGREPTGAEVKTVGARLAKEALAPLQDAEARDAITSAQTRIEQIIDIAGKDQLLLAGPVNKAEAVDVVQTFKQFIEEHHDEFVALRAYYGAPVKSRLSLEDVKKLAEAIKSPPYFLTPAKVWDAYEKLEDSRVKGRGGSIPADLVSLLRFTLGAAEELVPFPETVRLRYDLWLTEQGGSEKFTPQQLRWLEMVRDHVEESLTIETQDFDLDPFAQAGGIVAAHQAFGDELPTILEQLNDALVAA
jgi:type I restriction enzyme R subunit